jgi:hypothetical protein
MSTTRRPGVTTTGSSDATQVLAHLLLNSIVTLIGAASTLRDQRDALDEAAVESLFEIVGAESDVLVQVVRAIAAGRTIEAFEALAHPAA